jgi:hypothetical protein
MPHINRGILEMKDSREAAVKFFEEKGILNQEEFENRIKHKASKAGSYKSYRDIQFGNKIDP